MRQWRLRISDLVLLKMTMAITGMFIYHYDVRMHEILI